MKLAIAVCFALVAVAFARPAEDKDAQTIVQDFEQQPDGPFKSRVETSNGIKLDQQGDLKQVPDEDNKPRDVIVIRGSYSYLNTEGKEETINYFADETGYHAEGPSIPQQA